MSKKWTYKRVKVPTVLQMEALECGAACLAMILSYYGRYEALETMRIECGVSRDGSKAVNIMKAARKYGLETHVYKKEPDDLKYLKLPMIIFWNFNHFVILEGIKRKKVYINDPGSGPAIISFEEFDKSFTGLVITFEPGKDFKKGGNKPGFIFPLLQRLKGCKTALFYIFIAGLFLVIPGILLPILSKIFIDNILISRMDGWLKPLITGIFLTAIVRSFLLLIQKQHLLKLEIKLSIIFSSKFIFHIFRLPQEFFFQRFSGEIGNRVKINNEIANLLSRELIKSLLNFIMIIFYILIMFQYDFDLTIIGILIAVLNLFALRMVSRKRIDLNQRLLQERGKLTGTIMNGLKMIETLKSTACESDFFNKFAGYHARVVNAEQELEKTSQILSVLPFFLSSIYNLLILALGGIRTIDGLFTIGSLVAYQSLASSFMNPVNEIVNLGSKLQMLKGGINRIDDVLKYKKDIIFLNEDQQDKEEIIIKKNSKSKKNNIVKEKRSIYNKNILSGHIYINNITFGYNRLEPPLINDFSLKLKPGSRVAIIGGTGSGKSTIAKLIVGLFQPDSGKIFFDNIELNLINKNIFSNSVAFVDQEIFLFQGTIRDNITMWDDTVTEKQLIHASKDSLIHDDIMQRTGGYDSFVNEGGINFSGGQKQRIEIARALLLNPSILVMDEATSALDSDIEKQIDDNVRRRGCTTIIIAHRLSTIRDCDEIIVLDKGKIVERGSHNFLKDNNGFYTRLVNSE